MKKISRSPNETRSIAAILARKITGTSPRSGAKQRRAAVVALEGELGAGKTAFAQGFIRALGVREKVKSPTFLLIKSYKLKNKGRSVLYHVDCYRVKSWKELRPLGIKNILRDPAAIVLVEWPERIRPVLPADRTVVHLDHIDSKTRRITLR